MLDVTSHLIDPRIGVLVRDGRQIFYACIDGEFPERPTAQAVLDLLEGRAASENDVEVQRAAHDGSELVGAGRDYEITYRGKTAKKVSDFQVFIVGIRRVDTDHRADFTRVLAPTAAAAKQAMKEWLRRECIFDRLDGRIEITASPASL